MAKQQKRSMTLAERVMMDPNANFQPNSLCDTCEHALKYSKLLKCDYYEMEADWLDRGETGERYEDFAHHSTLEILHDSAVNGCHLCTLLEDSISCQRRAELEAKSGTNQDIVTMDAGEGLIVRIHCDWSRECMTASICRYGEKLQSPSNAIETYDEYTEHRFTDSRDGSSFALSTGSEMSVQLASFWLTQCKNKHTECQKTQGSSFILPKRLLYIQRSSSGNIRVRLSSRKELLRRGDGCIPEYFTLSHRWGNQNFCLKQENLESLLHQIPMEALPQTFQDAIGITERLGCQYLWIDSLCIIQPSPSESPSESPSDPQSDWQKESAIMGDIYAGSALTIAAAGNASCVGGLFTIRNPLRDHDCTTRVPRGRARFFQSPRNESLIRDHSGSREPTKGPELWTRGWVFQESVLSARTLIFDQDAMSWECVSCAASEIISYLHPHRKPFPTGYGHDERLLKNPFSLIQRLPKMPIDLRAPSWDLVTFYDRWLRLRRVYTGCLLTKPEDKLVAINGVIQKLEKRTGMHSVVGLWKELLPLELLWFRVFFGQPRPVSLDTSRAPSWSWAATDGAVMNSIFDQNDPGSHRYSCFLDVKKLSIVASPNGQFLHGNFVVAAPLQEFRPGYNFIAFFRPPGHDSPAFDGDEFFPDLPNATLEGSFAVLIVRTRPSQWRVFDAGIVVSKVSKVGGQDGVYRRIGYFQQCYGNGEIYPLFAGEKSSKKQILTLV